MKPHHPIQKSLKVLSYNIHKGFTPTRRKFVIEHIRSAIRSVDADLVCLQEVQGEHRKYSKKLLNWPESSQFEFLADEVWPHFAYGKNAVYQHGHHGNAILSRYPIAKWDNIDISISALAKRGLLHAQIKHPGFRKNLHVICLHLDLLKSEQKAQGGLLGERIRKEVGRSSPLVIAGDFNDWSLKLAKQMEQELKLKEAFETLYGKYARTFPAKLPALSLDRIYYQALKLKDATCLSKKPWNQLSDHLALYAEFEIGCENE